MNNPTPRFDPRWAIAIAAAVLILGGVRACAPSPKSRGYSCAHTSTQSACIQKCLATYKADPDKANACMEGVREKRQ